MKKDNIIKRRFVVIVPGKFAEVELRQVFEKNEFNGNYQDYRLRNGDVIEISGEIKQIYQLKETK